MILEVRNKLDLDLKIGEIVVREMVEQNKTFCHFNFMYL